MTIIIFLCFLTASQIPPPSAAFSADIAALRVFKSAIRPVSIPPTSCLATWNFSVDPCAVPRITAFICGVSCSGSRVVQLTLDSQGYSGTLTPEISKLTHLIAIDLGNNNIYGPIPTSISSLPNLRALILAGNSFSGAVPPSIGDIKSLETLDLSRNSLSGSLPEIKALAGLTRLDLSYNNLTGPLPKFPQNLNELALKSNSLSGSLPKSSFDNLTQLMVVELSHNSFTGALDSWLFLLPSLQQIDLAANKFAAVSVVSPPANSNSTPQLVAVDLSYNQIEGFLPENFADYPMLRSLSLSYNRFRGPIPRGYSEKGRTLQRLYLDGNYLNGSPPSGLFSVEGPASGSLGDNCLQSCPGYSELCSKSQKPVSICQQAYGGNGKQKPLIIRQLL